jgi:hypothetical protein
MDLSKAQNMESLRTNTNLILPLRMSKNITEEGRIELGRRETAERMLEVLEITSREDGGLYGRGLMETLDELGGDEVWEEGLRRVLTFVRDRKSGLSATFC